MRKTHKIEHPLSFNEIEVLSNKFEQLVFLNSNSNDNTSLLAVGAKAIFSPKENEVFDGLKQFVDEYQDWVFGYLSYDLKNEVEPSLSSNNPDQLDFPTAHFLFLNLF